MSRRGLLHRRPVLACLSAMLSVTMACSLSANEGVSASQERIEQLFPGFRAERLSYDGRHEIGVAQIQVCGPFARFIENEGIAELLGEPLDNASKLSADAEVYSQIFANLELVWNMRTETMTVSTLGEVVCNAFHGTPCKTRATPLANDANINGLNYPHGFADYLRDNPDAVALLGEPIEGVFLYNERHILRQYFLNGALEYDIDSGQTGVAPLGLEQWQTRVPVRSPTPGLCFSDSAGNPQSDFSVYPWHGPNVLDGVTVLGFGTPMGPTASPVSGLCTSLQGAIVCAAGAIVVLAIAGAVGYFKVTPERGSDSVAANTHMSDHVRVAVLLAGLGAKVHTSGIGVGWTASAEIEKVHQVPTVLRTERGSVSFGQPLPPHTVPWAEGLPDAELRDEAMRQILDDAAQAAEYASLDAVLEQLQQRERELRYGGTLLNEETVPWLDQVYALSDAELAEYSAELGMTAEALRGWIDEARAWCLEEGRQQLQVAEAVADVHERLENAAAVGQQALDAARTGVGVDQAIEAMAQEMITQIDIPGSTAEIKVSELRDLERAIIENGFEDEQYEELCLRAIQRALQLVLEGH